MRKRFAFLGVLALVLVLVFPARALAWDFIPKGVLYHSVLDDSRTGYVVSAYNQFDAAAYALGKDPNTIPADVKVKLSDSDYGGKFYDYAQSFFTQSGGLDNVPTWVPTYVIMVSELADLVYADYQAVWYSTATYSLYQDAMVDFVRVLNGEDLSGGSGGGGNITDFLEVVLNSSNPVNSNGLKPDFTCKRATIDSSGNVVLSGGTVKFSIFPASSNYSSTARLFLSPNWQSVINDAYSQGRVALVCVSAYTSNNPAGIQLIVCDSYSVVRKPNPAETSTTKDYLVVVNGLTYVSRGNAFYADGVGPFFVNSSADVPYPSTSFVEGAPDYWAVAPSSVAPPAGEWPEPNTPVSPDPPEVPTPTAPTVEPGPVVVAPTVTWPDIDITVNPPSVVVPTTPEGQDYTQLLTLINENLNSIDAYLQNFYSSFNSFRSDFLAGVHSIVDGLHNIYQYLGHLNDVLEVHCKHIRDQIEESVYNLELYIKRLFEWLPKQLNFNAKFNFDDSGIVNWLKQIYFKLGGGTYAPNPVADPGGFFEWLGGLVAGFLASLLAGLPDKVQELVSGVTDLTKYFPFSAPWDLYALLLLFAHDPVTPVFNIPWGMGGGHTVNVVVDCTQWDGVMAIVRSVEKIIFAGGLAKLTFDMFRPTDVMGD